VIPSQIEAPRLITAEAGARSAGLRALRNGCLWVLRCLLLAWFTTAMAQSRLTLANGEWPPYLSQKLPHDGSLSRVVTEAFETQGVKVDYRFYPWRRAYVEAQQGAVDGTLLWTSTPERQTDFLFSDPVYLTEDVMFYRRTNPLHWQQLSDLHGLVLGGAIGYTYGGEFDRLERQKVLHVERIANEEINFEKLLLGRIAAFPMDREVGRYIIAHNPHHLADHVDYDPRVILSAPLYLLLSRKDAASPELMRKFNAGLAELKRAGRIDQYVAEGRTAP
jgi:polar amino acid transport system substrate-binding protein